VVPRVIPAVVTLKVVEVPEIEDASVVGEVRLELVDQTAVYVIVADPMADPSVYVVGAFQESVSACATSGPATTNASTSANTRAVRFAFMQISFSDCGSGQVPEDRL
jgi:hypothetical protein